MSKSSVTENDLLKMILTGFDPLWRTGTTIYAALYTSDPGVNGTAITNEANYTNYVRVSITKSSGWTDSGSTFKNAGIITFPQCGAVGNVVTHIGLVSTSSGAGQLFYYGSLTNPLTIINLIQPQFAVGSLVITET